MQSLITWRKRETVVAHINSWNIWVNIANISKLVFQT